MIKNKNELIRNNTCVKARKLVLGALEAALSAADPKSVIKKHVNLKGDRLRIVDKLYSITEFEHIYVIGTGKASGYLAEAVNEIFDDKISSGLVIIPDYFKRKLETGNIKLWGSTHPIPSEKGVKGTNKMLDIVRNATSKDLVMCLISGGGSALMSLPYDGITITEKQNVTRILLRSGATIDEINTIRKHISAIKGGRLAEILSRPTLISLMISDVVGDRLETIASGPTVPDTTTFADAVQILKKYHLWNKIDSSVKNVLINGISGKIQDTPKPDNKIFRKVRNFIIGSNRLACEAAVDYLKSKKLNSIIFTTFMQGEARDMGIVASSIMGQINTINQYIRKPGSIIMGGETTVTVKGNGFGGRNQETVLSALRHIGDLGDIAIASIGTDGIDGNSNVAGALADTKTLERAQKKKMVPAKYLTSNDSYTFFKKLKDTIRTGSTGTNVNDILIMVYL